MDLTIENDPFSTSLERAMESAGYRSGAKFNAAHDAVVWSMLTPAEQREAFEYSQALAENAAWDRMIVRQINKTRVAYLDADGWHRVEWTEQEKSAERARFQGK